MAPAQVVVDLGGLCGGWEHPLFDSNSTVSLANDAKRLELNANLLEAEAGSAAPNLQGSGGICQGSGSGRCGSTPLTTLTVVADQGGNTYGCSKADAADHHATSELERPQSSRAADGSSKHAERSPFRNTWVYREMEICGSKRGKLS